MVRGASKVNGGGNLREDFSEWEFVKILVRVREIPPPSPQHGEALDVWQDSGYAFGSSILE